MEAKLIRYETEQTTGAVGQVAVIATKEEWIEVIRAIAYAKKDAPDNLINWLVNQGVYE